MISTLTKVALSVACLALAVDAQPVQRQQPPQCTNYTIIDTRGTFEPQQGGSLAFKKANQAILQAYPNGNTYNTVYPASTDQNSTLGTIDIIRKVHELVDEDSKHCIFLEGYSQGAAATVYAMPNITGKYFDAIKQVVMVGDPLRKPGLACNVDDKGGNATAQAVGIGQQKHEGEILDSWVDKTLDICTSGDGICDSAHGNGITLQHLSYIFSPSVHNMTANVIEKALQAN